jgi:hypothetical protein
MFCSYENFMVLGSLLNNYSGYRSYVERVLLWIRRNGQSKKAIYFFSFALMLKFNSSTFQIARRMNQNNAKDCCLNDSYLLCFYITESIEEAFKLQNTVLYSVL